MSAPPPKRTPPPKTLRFVWDPIFKLVPRKKPAKAKRKAARK